MPSPHLGWSHSKNFYNLIPFWTHLCQKSSSLDYTSKRTINVCHSLLFGIFIFIYICGMSACEYIYMWIYKICMYVSMYVCRYTCLWVYGGQRRVSDVYNYDPWQGLSLNPGFTSQLDWKPSSPGNNTVSILLRAGVTDLPGPPGFYVGIRIWTPFFMISHWMLFITESFI